MERLFGRAKTAQELQDEAQINLRRSLRTMDRKEARLARDEKKRFTAAKNYMRENNMARARQEAALVETLRIEQETLRNARNIQYGAMYSNTRQSTTQLVSQSLETTVLSMERANAALSITDLQSTLSRFDQQTKLSDEKEAQVHEALRALEKRSAEANAKKTTMAGQSVLDEISVELNLDVTEVLSALPVPGADPSRTDSAADEEIEKELKMRMEKLRYDK